MVAARLGGGRNGRGVPVAPATINEPLAPARPAPETCAPNAKPRTANAERQRRHRERKRRAALSLRDSEGSLVSSPSVALPITPRNAPAIDLLAYLAAIALAAAAAWFSIRGMVVLFPGSPLSVVGMACAMEVSKLVTAGWLARRWHTTAWLWRLVLVALVAGLAVINAAGVYAQLVSAHVGERGAATAAVEVQDATLAARIEVQGKTVADLDTRIAQIDAAVAEALRRGRTGAALAAMEGQRRVRASLVEERKQEAGTLAALRAERAGVATQGRRIETEAAPIAYVAAIVGVRDQETAIRWLIALMVLTCDPLAIALTAAASSRR
jgi:hypothetical protein